MNKTIYKSTIVNNEGVNGTSYAVGGNNFSVKLSPVAKEHLGTNPEQLIAFSWASCLNSTIQSIIRDDTVKSKVVIDVSLHKDQPVGLLFKLHARAAIEGKPMDQAESIVTRAHKHCPVSKLLSSADNVTVEAVEYSELADL